MSFQGEQQLDFFQNNDVMNILETLRKEMRATSRSLHAKIRSQEKEIEAITIELENLIEERYKSTV